MNKKRMRLLMDYLRNEYPEGCKGKKCSDCIYYIDPKIKNSNIPRKDVLVTILKYDICDALSRMNGMSLLRKE